MHEGSTPEGQSAMPPRFSKFGGRLVYLYLLRVPLLIWGVLVGFPFLAIYSPLSSLFENLFMLDVTACFIVTLAAVVLAWSILLTIRLVLLNGEQRFGTVQWLREDKLGAVSVLFMTLSAAPMVLVQFLRRDQFQLHDAALWWNIAAIAAGALSAYLLAFLALVGAVLTAPAGTQRSAGTFPAPAILQSVLKRADRRSLFPRAWYERAGRWFIRLPIDIRTGYIDPRPDFPRNDEPPVPNPGYGLLWSGHWLVCTFALLTLLLYLAIDWYKKAYLDRASSIPALGYVLLLLLNLNWVLVFAAFFLDRFRIPLLIPLGILAVIGTNVSSSDHFYKVQSGVSRNFISPAEAIAKRIQQGKPVIVVATAGGGIQAAAWTARVLTGLQHESLNWGKNRFADSVALISSVSGGATGSLFFLDQYESRPKGSGFQLADEGNNFQTVIDNASVPSLDDIAWALVYEDIPRILTPYISFRNDPLLDRGRMIELSWQPHVQHAGLLTSWRDGVKEGWRPATIFNSTLAESGEPLLLSTTDFERDPPKEIGAKQGKPRLRSFYDMFDSTDIPIVTAVRLAASFPYVSPAARAQTSQPVYHSIDGGYFDNYGVVSAIQWIDEALERTPPEQRPPVLVIQIRSFPDDADPEPRSRGWFFQSYAPLEGLLSVRTTGQLVRDRNALLLLRAKWKNPGAEDLPRIRFAGFEFKRHGAPLSWKMNRVQTDAIKNEWNDLLNGKDTLDFDQVHCFLDPSLASSPRCQDLARRKDPW
jgi:hypothetical protein